MGMWTIELPLGAPEFFFEYNDLTNDGWHASVYVAKPRQQLGTVEIFRGTGIVAEPNTATLRRAADTLRSHLVTVQFPVLRDAKPAAFARYVVEKASMAQRPTPADLDSIATGLVQFARDGSGLSVEEASKAADEIAVLFGLRNARSAPHNGPGIILLGTSARCALRRGEDVTNTEIRALATVRPGAGALPPMKDGFVAHGNAMAYFQSLGIEI